MLGHALCNSLLQDKKYTIYAFGRRYLTDFALNVDKKINEFIFDIDQDWENDFSNFIKKVNPDYVVNCIGVVKQLVKDNDLKNCININSIFVQKLNKIINMSERSNLIHLSTDCVFSGKKGNYSENDIVDPVDIYGLTKALGEIRYSKRTLTIRTSIIGREIDRKIGLLEWILNQNHNVVDGYEKFIFSGLTTYALSDLIKNTIFNNFIPGLMHISSNPISKYILLNKIKSAFKLDIKIRKSELPICDRSLDSSYFQDLYKYKVKTWDEMISQVYTLSQNYSK